ncbi:MAG TPA: GNAT family N-acetyltransferase [Rhizomicrobium sp.]|nr:GNAT family N-acetyltransferase [Rhizomicrobium sp.]
MSYFVDPSLLEAWLRARSLSRGLPQPVADSGGLRVDSGLPNETRRYLFPRAVESLRDVADRIHEPRIPLKLCDTPETLRSYLDTRWEIFPPNFVMTRSEGFDGRGAAVQLPEGYQLELKSETDVTHSCIFSAAGELAASGHAARYGDVFIYDRILTAEGHRRKGLGTIIMTALASARPAATSIQILVATPAGRELYRTLGWSDYAPYTSAVIPDTCMPPS